MGRAGRALGDGPGERRGGGGAGRFFGEAGELKLLGGMVGTDLYGEEFIIVDIRTLDLAKLGVSGTIFTPDLIRLSRWLGRSLGEGGDEKESDD